MPQEPTNITKVVLYEDSNETYTVCTFGTDGVWRDSDGDKVPAAIARALTIIANETFHGQF